MPTAPATDLRRVLTQARRALAFLAPGVAGGFALPVATVAGSPMHGGPAWILLVVAFFVAGFAFAWVVFPRNRTTQAVAVVLVGVPCWLTTQVSYPGGELPVALVLGLGLVPFVPRRPPPVWRTAAALLMAGTLLVVRWLVSVDAAALVLGVPVAVVAVDQFLGDQAATSGRARFATALGSMAVAGLFAVFWVGSTAPAVTWFGSLTSHGPRNGDEVAITFDDGPNGEDTLAIAAILEQYGVRGTFFLVGKAVEKQPEVARQLIAHGHVTGDHSFHHDAWRYLDPRYPELDRTQRTIQRLAGVCPSFFRPPHGTHTPFMSHVVDSERMSLVTWDVSARDWVEDDPARLARNILAKVRPGSIILLHDGIDGIPGADRSVVVQALPAILDGLRDRGLKPVTLDRLLGKDAYLPAAACGVKEGRGAPEAIRALR